MARNVFYSFHYLPDNWRASQVRQMGVIEGNRPVTDNDWETVTKGGDAAIRKWINDQMNGRSCTVVLIGKDTAGRKWINYEIEKSWTDNKGIVGININRLKDINQEQSSAGSNPFNMKVGDVSLVDVLKVYNPPTTDSKEAYKYISDNLTTWVEEAITIRNKY
jgi:MTH538 TIR-like domain (DUF1863)